MAPVIGRALWMAVGIAVVATDSGGTGGAASRLLQGRRRADPPEQQRRQHPSHHRSHDQQGGRRDQGLSARPQPDHASGRSLLLLRQRAGQDGRRVRHQDAQAGAADRAVGAAQQDRRQQEAPEDLRGHRQPDRPRCSGPGFSATGWRAGRRRRRDRHRHAQGDQEHSGPQHGAQHLRHAGRQLRDRRSARRGRTRRADDPGDRPEDRHGGRGAWS